MGKSPSKLTTSYMKQCDILGQYKHANTVPQRLEYYAKDSPDREAFVFVATDGARQAITFKELYEKSLQIARAFIKLGIQPKDYIAISLENCQEWLFIAFGAMIAGARPFGAHFNNEDGGDFLAMVDKLKTCTCVVMDPGFENENWNIMSKLIDTISPDGSVTSKCMQSIRLLFVHNSKGDLTPSVAKHAKGPSDNNSHKHEDSFYVKPTLSAVRSLTDLLDFGDESVNLPMVSTDDIAMVFRTSGSTEHSKFVSHTHYSITTIYDFIAETDFYNKDRYFSDRPFEWAGGFPFEIFIGQTRVTCFASPGSEGESPVATILKENCNVIIASPSILLNIEQQMICLNETAGAFLFDVSIATIQIFQTSDDFKNFDCGSVAPGCEIKIVDEKGQIVPINTRGEIYVRSKRMFTSYANDVMKTKDKLGPDGWYKTDDVGRMLENGALLVEGRKSNMILSAEIKVIPELIESLIRKCPDVEDTVVISIPVDEFHQVVCACVKGFPGKDFCSDVVRAFCENKYTRDRQDVSRLIPEYYLIVDKFPLTKTGKVSRSVLTDYVFKTFKEKF